MWKKHNFFNITLEYMFMYRHKTDKLQNLSDKPALTDIKDGQTGIIVSISGGSKAVKRLADLGLNPGTEIKVLRKTLFSGPVQIEVNGSRLVLGRGLASKISVDPK